MNFVFTNDDGRTYGGTAGLLHEMKLEGGYDAFMKNREQAAIFEFLDSPGSQDIIEQIAKKNALRKRIKMKSCG